MRRQPIEVYGFGTRLATRSPRPWAMTIASTAVVIGILMVLTW